MHEVSVISNIVSAILKELENHDAVSVVGVDLVIGDMTMLGDEQLIFAYEIVTRGTVLEGSELNIEHEGIEVKCSSCGYEGPIRMLDSGDYTSHKIPVMSCPECGGGIEMISGQSCCVRSIDIEESD